MIERILLPLALALLPLTPATAASPQEQRGKTFAMNNCAKCHSIDKVSPSPLKIAPPFRTLHKRYPVETLAEALAEGIQPGHPTMPEFRFDPGQLLAGRFHVARNCLGEPVVGEEGYDAALRGGGAGDVGRRGQQEVAEGIAAVLDRYVDLGVGREAVSVDVDGAAVPYDGAVAA